MMSIVVVATWLMAWVVAASNGEASLPPDVRRELTQARGTANEWISDARAGRSLEPEQAIALGYIERLRLGLGSPFRLAEMAMNDPRLSADTKHHVAWAILARTLSGDAYQVDPAALDRVGEGGPGASAGSGGQHLRLIEGAITEAPTPLAGELAVRLAYKIAAMEGTVPPHAPQFTTRAAAMIRDREIARRDASRLLGSSDAKGADPLAVLPRWRAGRLFRVEAPVLVPLAHHDEREALQIVATLLRTIRGLARQAATTGDPAHPEVRPSLLPAKTAVQLDSIAVAFNMPPRAALAVTVRKYQRDLLSAPGLLDSDVARREALATAFDDELFVARMAQIDRSDPDVTPSRIALWVAVALRPYAQEPAWMPGMGGPRNREVEEHFGLASLRFDADIPSEWRPYLRASLVQAIRDMQRVMPALELKGVNVRFGATNHGSAPLAMHDPKRREIILPPSSAAGTLAHEIAHDIDWQIARKRFKVRGDYGTDRVARARGDRLHAHVQTLGSATDEPGVFMDYQMMAHARRPTENFARAVDWFVTAALASDGRTNGHLSSIQDGVLTGYGSARPPDVTGRTADAILRILDEVAPLYPETRHSFAIEHGSGRSLSALDLARTFLETRDPVHSAGAGAARALAPALEAIVAVRDRAFGSIYEWTCRMPAGAYDRQLERARRDLVIASAAARSHGVAMRYARRVAGDAGARWMSYKLNGGPEPQHQFAAGTMALLEDAARLVAEMGSVEMIPPPGGFALLTWPDHCPL
jgi:hypothetical protein